tara:strand:+ start:753 stop:911 length:159 start_codon:yes stop_codon:yes gene_type:complete
MGSGFQFDLRDRKNKQPNVDGYCLSFEEWGDSAMSKVKLLYRRYRNNDCCFS